MHRQCNPSLALAVGHAVRGRRQSFIRETPARDANFFWRCGEIPKQRGAAIGAKVALLRIQLIVFLRSMAKGVNLGLAAACGDGGYVEISRDAKRTAGAAFAVGAVSNTVHRGQGVDGDRGLAAGAGGGHRGEKSA